jgi:lipopolysaccharide export system protein LptA
MRMPPLARCAAVLCAGLVLACAAHAEKADREKPITFTSDDGEVNYEKRTGVLKGNVVITQGTLTIRADRIDFKQNADNSLSATAFGKPLAFRQKRDDTDGYYEGWAQRAEYDGTKEQLELFDNAILKRGDDEIRSNYISYNSATEQFKAEGRASTTPVPGETGRTDRVRGIFQPKDGGLPGAPKGPAAKGAETKPAPLTLKPSGEIAPASK